MYLLTSRINCERRRRAERSQRWNAFSVNLGVAVTQMSTRRTSTNKLWGRGEIKVASDKKQKLLYCVLKHWCVAVLTVLLWNYWWGQTRSLSRSSLDTSSKSLRGIQIQNKCAAVLLQYRIINVLWKQRVYRFLGLTVRPFYLYVLVRFFFLIYSAPPNKKNIDFTLRPLSFKPELLVDQWPAPYFTNTQQRWSLPDLHEGKSVKIDQSSGDQREAARKDDNCAGWPNIL